MIKKLPLIITLLALMLPGGMAMAASPVTFDFSTQPKDNSYSNTIDGIKLDVPVTGKSNFVYDTSDKDIDDRGFRAYEGATFTFTIPQNLKVTKVEFFSGSQGNSVQTMSFTDPNGATWNPFTVSSNGKADSYIWEGNLTNTEAVFTLHGTGNVYFNSIIVTYVNNSEKALFLTSQPLTLKEGETGQLQVTATDKNNATVTGLTYTYKSDNTNFATVDGDGTVTAVAAGTANITVSYAGSDKYDAAQATSTVTVSTADGRSPYDEAAPWDGQRA